MLEFNTRKVGDYLEIKVEVNDNKIDLGLLDIDERLILAKELSQAATDILNSL